MRITHEQVFGPASICYDSTGLFGAACEPGIAQRWAEIHVLHNFSRPRFEPVYCVKYATRCGDVVGERYYTSEEEAMGAFLELAETKRLRHTYECVNRADQQG